RAGGDEQPRLLAQELGGALLEGDDGGIVAEDVVADLGLGHGPAHLRRRLRDRVRAKVDDRHWPARIARMGLLSSAFRRTDPWCSGPTCQPVTLEIAGSNPVGSATRPHPSDAPFARPNGASLRRRAGQGPPGTFVGRTRV